MSVADLERMFGYLSKRFEDTVITESREIAGATSATVMPSAVAKFVKFKALGDNAGTVYIGVAGVTKADGTSDDTSGWPLAANEEYGPVPCTNLNNFYRICDNAGDDLIAHLYS